MKKHLQAFLIALIITILLVIAFVIIMNLVKNGSPNNPNIIPGGLIPPR